MLVANLGLPILRMKLNHNSVENFIGCDELCVRRSHCRQMAYKNENSYSRRKGCVVCSRFLKEGA